MAANKLIFADAAKVRDSVTDSQKIQISKLYNDWADEIGERAKYYQRKTTASSVVSERQMREFQNLLRQSSERVSNEVYKGVKNNMYIVSDSVVNCNKAWLSSLGFPPTGINAAFNSVPDSVVRSLVTGSVYDSGWSLSSRIWGNNEETLKDIYGVVAKGVAQNKPLYDIAKNLEAYVRPGAKLPWNLEADGVKIFKKQVDYNAQRLGRTLVQHTYQQTFIHTTKDNPFVIDYIWESNGSRACPMCIDRDGEHFSKDNLPMDHPNGMCTMIPNVVEDLEQQLADWVNAEDGTYPEIDEFSKSFGYTPSPAKSKTFTPVQNKYLSPYGFSPSNMPKKFDDWSYKVSFDQAAEILDSMGTSWSDPHPYQKLMQFYNKNLVNNSTKIVGNTLDDYKLLYGNSDYKSIKSWLKTIPSDVKDDLMKIKNAEGLGWKEFYSKYFYSGSKGPIKLSKAVKSSVDNVVKELVTNKIDDVSKNLEGWLSKIKDQKLKHMLSIEDSNFSKLSASEIAGLKKYTGYSYRDMNSYLRHIGRGKNAKEAIELSGISDDQLKALKQAKKALEKAPLSEDMVLRRGTDLGDLAGLLPGDFHDNELKLSKMSIDELNKMFQGTIGEYSGFTSTSSLWDRGFSGDVEIVFYAPKGTKASSIMNISQYGTAEGETLLAPGTKVRISKIEESDGHKGSSIRVFMEVLLD